MHDDASDLAARGKIGLAGTDAVPDSIDMMPEHRRRDECFGRRTGRAGRVLDC
jgi:hypothetical protein